MFISVLIIVLLGVASGKNTILYDKLIRCIKALSSNLHGTMSQVSRCAHRAFNHCYQDTVTNSKTKFLLYDECGFLDSYMVLVYYCEWNITTKRTVWIDILLFELHFVDFPCSIESLTITDHGMDHLYCGVRFPWKHYATVSTVSVRFHSDITNKGMFQIYYQDGQPIHHKTHVLPAKLAEQHLLLHDQHYCLRRYFLYFIVHRMQAIQADISSLAGSRIAIYDGPGVKSIQKSVSDNITSSSFIMLLAVDIAGNSVKLQNGQAHFFVRYRAINNVLGNCSAKEKCSEGNFYMHINLANDNHGAHGCVWNVPAHVNSLNWSSLVFTGPETLLDNEACIYGGIFVYSKKNITDLEEMLAICRKDKHVKPNELLDISGEDLVVTLIRFRPYSTMHGYVKSLSSGSEYKKRIKTCNSDKVCELRITFPNEVNLRFETDVLVQYYSIGTSTFSTRITFSQQMAPAYYASFESSTCYTPPQLCTCISLQLKYSAPLSYFVHEANRVDSDFMPTSELSWFDISFASSLLVNLSACEGRYPRTWWLIKFRYIDTDDIADIKIRNRAYPLQLATSQESYWVYTTANNRFRLNEFLPREKSSSYWFLLHIMPRAPPREFVTNNDEIQTKVCIRCLSCHDVKIHVETLSPEKDKSFVYTVSDHSHLEDESVLPKSQWCSVGLLCNTCNIILTYRGSRARRCPCGYFFNRERRLTIVATKTAYRKKQAYLTSIKRTPVSKVSNM